MSYFLEEYIKLVVNNKGDSIGFIFSKFAIWKTTRNKYLIRRKNGKIWTADGWQNKSQLTNTQSCKLYLTFKDAYFNACRLLNSEIKNFEEENRFEMMDME